ncbi:HlyD family efflux transporter periplasmic adaptor subunit [Flavobacteriaceae bacterium TP-CH-4]|uniref:HlyD family efflux transporter periplasmic adaptor subunit n=1 Tax=Pelagihabitans pacificus TaxID=2696054 RepID=A0A967ARS2_9FLAO|nr:HlyD family efflux transporter periplasmic adaptor subunit [Pelagihabitans pacificus]NHF57733.1 HlyD family efflux transporter periplasmic adaptor subunit [Pelagihabitans pacificus]
MIQKIVLSSISLLLLSCGSKNEGITPEKKTLTESVYASAIVQPDSLYEVYSSVAGILDIQFVQEGDTVSKGQPLFQIFNKTPDLNKENAKLNLQKARDDYNGNAAVLGGLEKEIQTARLKFMNDSVNYMRQKRLWEQKIGSQAEFDNIQLNYKASANNLQVLKNNYDRTKNDLLNRLQQATNSYRSALVSTKDFTILSKINGRAYAIYKNVGEIITAQQPLASLGSASVFVVELLVDEVDIVQLNTGQKVLITLDAYANQVFEGKVAKIYPKKDERNQTFKVEAVFNEAPEVLYPGLAGEANIIIDQKENVLTIPLEYLLDDSTVLTDEGTTEVKTGTRNLREVEILSGIDETTIIYKPKQ